MHILTRVFLRAQAQPKLQHRLPYLLLPPFQAHRFSADQSELSSFFLRLIVVQVLADSQSDLIPLDWLNCFAELFFKQPAILAAIFFICLLTLRLEL